MLRRLALTAALLTFAGCPSNTPDAGQFAAGADSFGNTSDLAGAADTGAGSDTGDPGVDAESTDSTAVLPDGAADAASPDGSSLDANTPDAGSPDAADTGPAPTGPCANGLGLFAKTADTGADESIFGMAMVPSGGAVLVGGTGSGSSSSDAVAVRVGGTGAVQWSKTLGNPGADVLRGVAAAGTDLVAVGSSHFLDASDSDGWWLKLDSKGSKTGENHYGDGGNDGLYGIVAAGDGWLLAGSNRPSSGYEDGWLVRTDASGGLLWQKTFGGSQIDEFHAIAALKGGNFALVGSNGSDAKLGSDVWLVVVDGTGKQLNSKLINKGEYDQGECVTALDDGGMLLGGVVSNNGNPDLWVARADADGNVFWQDLVTGNQSETAWGIAAWADGSFAVVGESSSGNNGALGGIDGWLLRYDAYGNRIRNKKFGGTGNEWFKAAVALPDHGLWIGGHLWQSGGMDAWALRVDPWGHSSCTGAGLCKNIDFSGCSDGQPCTADQCEASAGCSHTPLLDGATCGDGLQCAANQCTSG